MKIMTIEIKEEKREEFRDLLFDELDYKIFESGCPEEYEGSIETMCDMLEVLGYSEDAKSYRDDYKQKLEEEDEE